MRRSLAVLVAGAFSTAVLAAPATAAVTGDVISAANASTGRTVVFSATDGSQRKELTCGGSLSNRFPNGIRYFAFEKEVTPGHRDLYAVDEDCGIEVALTSDPALNVRLGTVSWSPSGNRIAFYAVRTETTLLGSHVTEGVFVGKVERDLAGRPHAVSGIRFAFSMITPRAVSWSGDEQRVTVGQELPSERYVGGTQGDVFLGNVDTGWFVNLTNSEVGEYHPAFSPTADRITYVTKTSKSGNYRNDIFVIDLASYPSLVVSQLTNKSNTNAMQILHPCYSPDGASIAFSGWPTSGHGANIYKLKADGSGKAVDLTSSSPDIHYVPQWRS